MIPLIEKEKEFYKIILPLDVDGNEQKTYWAKSREEIPSIVEKHVSRIEEFSRYNIKS
ncbi:MAG: hypothetical protein WC584_03890 [Candidatus Pacearchaeota archaeon]